MDSLVVRRALPEDMEGFAEVRSMVYRGGMPVPVDDKLVTAELPGYVVRDAERVYGGLTAVDMLASRGVENLRSAGVAAVGVLPEYRRSGVGSRLMSGACRAMREDGFLATSLYAFREPFYRKSGYEVAGRNLRINCPSDRIPKLPNPMQARRLSADDFPQLAPALQQFCVRYSGGNVRTEAFWRKHLGGDKLKTIFAAGDPVEAYAILDLSPDFWVDQEVREFVYNTREGYEAMIEVFRCIGMNKNKLIWIEPSDGPFYSTFLDYPVPISGERPIMFRILDVPKALSLLHPGGAGQVTFRVIDPDIPENDGPWQVEFEYGKVLVQKSQAEPDFVLTIRQFSQAYFGEPSLKELARNGYVIFDHPAALVAADTLMPHNPVVCLERF